VEENLWKFKFISDESNDAHFLLGRDSRFQYVNKAASKMTGYSESELLELCVSDVDVGYDLAKYQELFDLINEEIVAPVETTNKRKDGSLFPSEITVTGYQIGGERYMFAALRDITERKRAEHQIKASLKEKEILLAEIHHRVKNNLQIVASLFNLNAMQTDNQEAKDVLQDARGKVFSMTFIHSQLYQQERFDEIDMGTYTRRLVGQLSHAYNDRARSIRTVVEPSDIYLSLNQAIPCGLVMNELISNALKHAFKERQKGTVAVTVSRTDDMITIKVKDDGIGIPGGADIDKSKTMGFELVKGLVNQLGGTVQFRQDKGTEVTVKFKSDWEEKQHA
jgi:PAS domain S-box-containing protein